MNSINQQRIVDEEVGALQWKKFTNYWHFDNGVTSALNNVLVDHHRWIGVHSILELSFMIKSCKWVVVVVVGLYIFSQPQSSGFRFRV